MSIPSNADSFDWAEKMLKSSSVENLQDLRKVAMEGVKECLESFEKVPNAAKPFFPRREMEQVFYISKESEEFFSKESDDLFISREWSRASTEAPSESEVECDLEVEQEKQDSIGHLSRSGDAKLLELQRESSESYVVDTPRTSGPRSAGAIEVSRVRDSPMYERFDDWRKIEEELSLGLAIGNEIEEKPRTSMNECEHKAPLEKIDISGAEGANSEFVNGQYRLQAAFFGGKPCWRKCDNANIWLLSFPNSGKWYVTSTADKMEGVHAGWAVFKGDFPIEETAVWKFDNGEEWVPQYLTVSMYEAVRQTAAAVRLQPKFTKSHLEHFEDYGWKPFDAEFAQRLVRSPLSPIHEKDEETTIQSI